MTAIEEDISKMIKRRRKSVSESESREGMGACVRCEFGYKSHSD